MHRLGSTLVVFTSINNLIIICGAQRPLCAFQVPTHELLEG